MTNSQGPHTSAYATAGYPPPSPPARKNTRTILVAALVAAVLIAGLGGYLVGHRVGSDAKRDVCSTALLDASSVATAWEILAKGLLRSTPGGLSDDVQTVRHRAAESELACIETRDLP